MRTDSELVRAALAGQREAAGEIYDRYIPLVRGIVRDSSFSRSESDEVLQEIFLRVLSHLRSLRQPDHLAGWIVQITRNQVADFQRRAVVARRREGSVIREPVDPRSKLHCEDHERVHAAIAQLGDKERLAIHIFYLCEEPAEVARQALGLSASGFYKIIENARSRLRAILSQQEVSR